MAPLIHTDTAQETKYETPTFSPSGAFARTLRGGELDRLGRLARQNDAPAPTPRFTGTTRRYETPTFDPRGAFARTLRGGEIARRARIQAVYA
jgi:hypothetical protein